MAGGLVQILSHYSGAVFGGIVPANVEEILCIYCERKQKRLSRRSLT